jgi:hypothetical protein
LARPISALVRGFATIRLIALMVANATLHVGNG